MCRIPAAALLTLTLAVGCSEPPGEDRSFHAWFNALRDRAERGDGSWEAVSAGSLEALPIVRIELKRSQVYDFSSLEIVFADGDHATRRGGMLDWPAESAESAATCRAEVPFHEYARLCWLIESLDLPSASASWSVRVSHGEQLSITWTTRAGRTVELSDYGHAGPPVVGALAAAIENTARRLAWTASEDGDEDEQADGG